MKWLADATPWLFRFVQDSRTGQPSVKRYGLALAVTVLCGIMLGLGASICYIIIKSQTESQVEMIKIACNTLENISLIVAGCVTGNYLFDKAGARKAENNAQSN